MGLIWWADVMPDEGEMESIRDMDPGAGEATGVDGRDHGVVEDKPRVKGSTPTRGAGTPCGVDR